MPGQKASEQERRQQILAAAFRVAVREGIDKMTMRDVAAEAGLSSGLMFFHFETREALLLAMLDDLCAWLAPPDIPTGLSRKAAIKRVENHLTLIGDDRARIELFLQYWVLGGRQPEVRARLRAAMARFRASFVPAEQTSNGGISAETFATLMTTFIVGSTLQALLDGEQGDERLSLAIFTALLRGL